MRIVLVFMLVAVSNLNAAVTGTVVDAQTGAAIKSFSTVARPDNPRSIWQQHTVQHHTDGHFAITRRLWESSQIRVWADGYRPAVAAVKQDDPQKLAFRLERDPGLRGSVVNENGKPITGTTVALATLTSEPTISNGKMTLSGSATEIGLKTVETAADGSFILRGEIDPATLVVVHETGCAEGDMAQLGKPIVLKPWGTIEGRLLLGHKPGADWLVTVQKSFGPDRDHPSIRYRDEIRADPAGKFVFTHVWPARVHVGPQAYGTSAWIEVRSGLATSLTLGGEGRPVIGKLVAASGADVDWSTRKFQIRIQAPHVGFPGDNEMWAAQAELLRAAEGAEYIQDVTPQPDGSFRAEAVPQGTYQLIRLPVAGHPGRFDVPPMDGGSSDEPLDLGTLTVLNQ